MPKTKNASTISYVRGPAHRPWLSRSLCDRQLRETVMHVDLYAFAPALFVIEYRLAGKQLVARDVWDASLGVLIPSDMPETLPPALYWTRETHRLFAPVHRALLARERGRTPELWESATTLLCHYVRCLDANPWPRGALNSFKGRNRGRKAVIGKSD